MILKNTDQKLPSHYYNFLACSRKIDLRIFPVEVLGSSQKTTYLGILNPDSFFLQNSITSCSYSEHPVFYETKAQGTSPHFSSGRATTAASRMSSCW